MFSILLHSSKTMRLRTGTGGPYQRPPLLDTAEELASYMQTLSVEQIMNTMQLSRNMAEKTKITIGAWTTEPAAQLPAIDAFLGDIYSGLQVQTFSEADRDYANRQLVILSGLYGGLRALDSITPYRLEMGYKLPEKPYRNLYQFWGDSIARLVPVERTIINLSAAEYTKAVLPHLPHTSVIAPKFLTIGASGEPVFVTVHAKIARGAFAHWLIRRRAQDEADLRNFSDLNYRYDMKLSTPQVPVFVCKTFGGLGLSVRLS